MLLRLLAQSLNYSFIWGKDEWKWRNNLNSCCSSTWRHSKATLKPQLSGQELCWSHYPNNCKRRDWKVVCCFGGFFYESSSPLLMSIPSWQWEVHLKSQQSSSIPWCGHPIVYVREWSPPQSESSICLSSTPLWSLYQLQRPQSVLWTFLLTLTVM